MRVGQLSTEQKIVLSNVTDLLNKMKVGESIRAQLIDQSGNEVTLKLSDGSVFKATTLVPLEGELGNYIKLSLNNKNENQFTMEVLKNNETKQGTVQNELLKALTAMQVVPNEQNLEIVQSMKTTPLPLNRETFDKITEFLTKFKEVSPSKAAFLIAGDLAHEEKNIVSLNQIVDEKFKIGHKMDEMVKQITDIPDSKILESILYKLSENNKATASKVVPSNEITTRTNLKQEKIDNSVITRLNIESLKNAPKKLETGIIKAALEGNIEKEVQSNLKFMSANDQATIKTIFQDDVLKSKLINLIKSSVENSDGSKSQDIKQKLEMQITKELASSYNLPKENLTLVSNILKDAVLKTAVQIGIQDIENNQLLKYGEMNDGEDTKQEIQKIFDKLFVKIDSKELSNDLNIKNIYNETLEKLEIIKESLQNSTLPMREELLGKIDTLQNNLRFIDQINSHNTYIQIPINLWDKNTTGELYILKRDTRKKKIDPDNVTVFLSLDTENLGRVDSLIQINKKAVSINLRVEEEEIFQVIKQNYKELYTALKEKGYHLVDMKYKLIEEEVNLLNIKEAVQKENSSNQIRFDYKI